MYVCTCLHTYICNDYLTVAYTLLRCTTFVCRLRSSRILVCGLTGVAAEVCKNIVLAGVKSLTILDPNPFGEMELGARFLIPHGEESKPVS